MSFDRATVFHAGQRWRYETPAGCEESRILVGAVLSFAEREPIVCCAVPGAQRLRSDGMLDAVTIPFLPLTASALAASVTAPDGEADLPPEFADAFAQWQADPRGLAAFTVPFKGRLDRLIARQMAVLASER